MNRDLYDMTVVPVLALILLGGILYVIMDSKKVPGNLPELICFPADKSFHVLDAPEIPANPKTIYPIQNHPLTCDEEHGDICHE